MGTLFIYTVTNGMGAIWALFYLHSNKWYGRYMGTLFTCTI